MTSPQSDHKSGRVGAESSPSSARSMAEEGAPALSVVVPAHNEAANLPALLGEIRDTLESVVRFEILVVDDGSSDQTPALLEGLRPGFPWLRIVRHPERRGQSAALLSGIRNARAPWIATLDGDGQNDPADIPRLWDMVRGSGPDNEVRLVAGHRVRRRDTWLKRLSSRIANGVRGRLLGDRTPDTGCGLKLFDRETALALPHFDHFHRFLPALVQRGGGRVISVEVGHRPRAGGRSHYGVHNRLWVGIVDLLGVMWLQRRAIRPLGPDRAKHED